MAGARVTEVHQGLFLGLINPTPSLASLLESCLSLRGSRSQSLQGRRWQSWNELGVTEALVVAAVAKELDGIFQEKAKVLRADICLLRKAGPVSVAGTVKGDNEVVDRFGFGRDLTQGNSGTFECGSRSIENPGVSDTQKNSKNKKN